MMSYGSTFLQFESSNGRISQKFSRPSVRREHLAHERSKGVNYEKQFDVSLTRVDSIPDKVSVRESMLAYSRKMRSLQDSRLSENSGKGDPLFVRAKHIPKYPVKVPKKRRPMSFDELLGRDRDVPADRPNGARPRPASEKTKPQTAKSDNEIHLPLLSDRLKKSTKNVHVSLVSASDLYDIVDFSLKSKGTRNDSLKLLRLEQEVGKIDSPNQTNTRGKNTNSSYDLVIPNNTYAEFERQSEQESNANTDKGKNKTNEIKPKDLVVAEHLYKEIFGTSINEPLSAPLKLPSVRGDAFKRRPNRAKRMRLVDSGLGDIPEDNIVEINNSVKERFRERARIASPPPQQSPSRKPEPATALDIINENIEVSHQEGDEIDSTVVINGAQGRASSYKYSSGSYGNSYAERFNLVPEQSVLPTDDSKSTKRVIKDDGDVRIEVTQCPPKHETMNAKLKAQKRFKKLIYLRDSVR